MSFTQNDLRDTHISIIRRLEWSASVRKFARGDGRDNDCWDKPSNVRLLSMSLRDQAASVLQEIAREFPVTRGQFGWLFIAEDSRPIRAAGFWGPTAHDLACDLAGETRSLILDGLQGAYPDRSVFVWELEDPMEKWTLDAAGHVGRRLAQASPIPSGRLISLLRIEYQRGWRRLAGATRSSEEPPEQITAPSRAVAIIQDAIKNGRPVPPIKILAAMAGTSKATLYRDLGFKTALASAREMGSAPPRGTKDANGFVEAAAPEDEE